MILVRTTPRRGVTTTETQYAVTSVPRERADAAKLQACWCGLWKIENSLHDVRDVTLGEDVSRIRQVSCRKSSAVRNAVISLLRAGKTANIAATQREFAWHPQCLFAKLGRGMN